MSDRKPARDLSVGTRLANRYTLARRLGRGGAAETWLATDRITGAAVALKVLADERVGRDALRREWQLAIRMMHAHIVRAFEFHDDDGAFYSLQFIDGPDIGVLAGASPAESLPPVGRPNACNLCHLDRTLGWTEQHLVRWYGHAHEIIDDWAEQLVAVAHRPASPGIGDPSPFTFKPW